VIEFIFSLPGELVVVETEAEKIASAASASSYCRAKSEALPCSQCKGYTQNSWRQPWKD